MNLFTKIYSFLGGNATRQSGGEQMSSPASSAHESSAPVSVDIALQISTVWACIEILVESLSSLPVFVYKKGKDGREKAEGEIIYRIFHEAPNAFQTCQEFWETMFLSFFLRGNAYARITRNKNGEAISFWPLAADQMRVMLIEGKLIYIYTYEGKDYIYENSDILHIKGKGNGLVGLSLIQFMAGSANLAIKAQNHTMKTFRKEARRPGILKSEHVLTKDQRAALKRNFSEIVTGGEKELFILEADLEFTALGMSPADIQLLETRNFSVEEICRWFGVPTILVNHSGQNTKLGSSVGEIISGFYRIKLRPQLTRVEQAISKRSLTSNQRARGYCVEFNLDALLRSSLKDRMEIYAKGTQNGIYKRNECRNWENLPEVEKHGDTLTVQSNLMALENIDKIQPTIGKPTEEPIKQ